MNLTPEPGTLIQGAEACWILLFSACLAAVGVYDLLYVVAGLWRRRRSAKAKWAQALELTRAKADADAKWKAKRMATPTDRKDPPIP